MSDIIDGRYQGDTVEEVVDALMKNAKNQFGEDLNDDQTAVIRMFYIPVAEEIVKIQEDIGLVLDSAQIEHADGTSLDLLTSLIGVKREEAQKSTGEVEFSRSTTADTDYPISKGTEVQTDSTTPTKFVTTESTQIDSGTKTATAAIEAEVGGVSGNVGANTITYMPDPPKGVEDVTNNSKTSGGQDREPDNELRERAQTELAEGARATAAALHSNLIGVDTVRSVSMFINDSSNDNTGSGGLPPHSFEVIVEGGPDGEVAQTIFDTKSITDESYGGANGSLVSATAELINGQTFDIDFSRPNPIDINFDISLEVTDEYDGDDEVRDNIINYVGGLLSTGNSHDGDLRVGDDVIQSKVMSSILNVDGIHDITNLEFDATSDPTNTTNYVIGDKEVATSDATDGSISITTTQV